MDTKKESLFRKKKYILNKYQYKKSLEYLKLYNKHCVSHSANNPCILLFLNNNKEIKKKKKTHI